jgi:isochorismate pyruvate lyase
MQSYARKCFKLQYYFEFPGGGSRSFVDSRRTSGESRRTVEGGKMSERVGTGPAPEEATTMAEVRAAIDAIDRDIVTLLGRRMRWIEAAGRIKPERGAVRDQWRKDDVHAKVEAEAEKHHFPPALLREIYELLMEGSIAHEFEVFDARGY